MFATAPPPEYPGYAQAPNDPNVRVHLSRGDKIDRLFQKYEISHLFREKLEILSDFKIVFIVDDSGSMNTPLEDSSPHSTRWDELKQVVETADIGSIYSSLDINFLNRSGMIQVSDFNQVSHLFTESPNGTTPLSNSLLNVLRMYQNYGSKILIVIATDGVPNDLDLFKRTLINKNHSKFYVSFLACSDNDKDVGYLNELDKNVPNDVDDYISEKKEVLKAQGKSFSYTYADHVARLLLGPLVS